MKIWANTLVKNEGKYIWFSLMSVIEEIDKILVWDTGSTDATCEIIKEVKRRYPSKVEFKEVGDVDVRQFTQVRQEMLKATKSDWFMILDGDEVWWDDTIKKNVYFIKNHGNKYESIVNRYYNLVGDIYHFQEEEAGKYSIDAERGHLNIRFTSLAISGLHYEKPHGQLGLNDQDGTLIQNRPKEKRQHLGLAYLHFTNMSRSSSKEKDSLVPKREMKYKLDLGHSFPRDFYYPEVFFRARPEVVGSPWLNRTQEYFLKSLFKRPGQLLKRRLFTHGNTGY
jgi:hypothetical protein